MIASKQLAARWRRAWQADGWLRPFLKQYRRALLASLALGAATMLFAVGLMFCSGFLISDAAERPELGLFSLLIPLGLVQVFGIGKPFLAYKERLSSHDWVLHISSSLRLRLYEFVEDKNVFWSSGKRAGELLGLLAEDIEHVQDLYLKTVFPLATAWIISLGALLAFSLCSPLFALLMLLALAVLVLLMPLAAAVLNAARREQAKALSSQFYAQIMDDLGGIDDWRFAQRKADFMASVAQRDTQLLQLRAELSQAARRRNFALQVFFGICSMAVLIWASLHFASMEQATAASGIAGRPADWIAAFVIGFFPLLEAFQPLGDAAVESHAHLSSIERLNALNSTDSANSSQAPSLIFVDKPSQPATAAAVPAAASIPQPQGSEIHINELSFSYEAQTPLLQGIELRIPAGSKVALLGPSGCGKSSLLSLIRGDLVASSGSVRIGGIEASHLGEYAHEYLAVISQNSQLFARSLYDNLALGDPEISRNQAKEALIAVGLNYLLERSPEGIDAQVDEGGLNFSGGERQRIALARVLLRRAPIVLLDEPCASLDPKTEHELLESIFQQLSGRTIIMVSHHLAGIEHMDRVLFLEDGRISLDGSPSQLQAESPRFRQLLEFDRGLGL